MLGNSGSRIASWIIGFLPVSRWHGLKRWLLRNLGGLEIGDGVCIWSGARFSGRYIRVGKNCHIGEGCCLSGLTADAWLEIGDEVSFGPHVFATTGAHYVGPSSRRSGEGRFLPIKVGDGTAVCVNATIMAGTTIGAGSVIMPGCVVGGKIAPNTMVSCGKVQKFLMPETSMKEW